MVVEEKGVQHPGGGIAAKCCAGFRRMCVWWIKKMSPGPLARVTPGTFYEESSKMAIRLLGAVPARDAGQHSGCNVCSARVDRIQPRQAHRRRRPES